MTEEINPTTPDQLLKNQTQGIYKRSRLRRYLLLSLFLPPLGFFLAWKEKLLPLVLPAFLIAESTLFAISLILTILSLKPTLALLQINPSSIFTSFYWSLMIISFILASLGIIFGFYFQGKVHRNGFLPPKGAWVMSLLIVSHYLLGLGLLWYINSAVLKAFGDLQPVLENLNQTQQFLH